MAEIIRKLKPLINPIMVSPNKTSEQEEEGEEYFNSEYSIAIEYLGSPVAYNLPHAHPVDFNRISMASPISQSRISRATIPVIHPIMSTKSKKSEIVEENYMNPARSSEESERASSTSRVSSGEEEERPTIAVRFREPETMNSSEWSDEEERCWEHNWGAAERRVAVRAAGQRKGSCYRCGKGGRLTHKEECLVCSAKYCRDCVVRSMGSMPEGRKCVECIGERINEASRRRLGKSSRLLRRLLCDIEVEQIMTAETTCKANQLPANLVHVNGQPLSSEELEVLQKCSRPPKKLKPGRYWYDNVAGFWGKEGQVISEIVSPQLNVGGHIKRDCSNGNTDILINNREITKSELWILQVAGVPCEGKLHYWVNPDGTYQEEGMNNVKGKIWDKPRVKLACALLNLPILSDSTKPSAEQVDRQDQAPLDSKKLYKFLLIGSDQSGTSTIFKQARSLYDVPFSDEERQNIKSMIQSKLYGYIGLLLEGREMFEEESLSLKGKSPAMFDQPGPSGIAEQETTPYSIGPRLKSFEDLLLKVMTSGNLDVIFPVATREYAQYVEDLWNDPAIQATYSRRNELERLPRAASYFLNRAVEISRTDYEPTDTDILYAEGITSSNSVASMDFSITRFDQDNNTEAPLSQQSPNQLLRSRLIRVHPSSLGEKCKWLPMFEEVDAVLFCVSLSDYDNETSLSDDFSTNITTNKMMEAKRIFESVATHPSFEGKPFLLLLNKLDLLEEKIEQVPLTRCEWFSDFRPVLTTNPKATRGRRGNGSSNSPPLAHRAFQYVAVKFKRLFTSLTDRKLYVSLVNGLESDTIDDALKYTAEILKWEEEKPNKLAAAEQQISSASIEASSSS